MASLYAWKTDELIKRYNLLHSGGGDADGEGRAAGKVVLKRSDEMHVRGAGRASARWLHRRHIDRMHMAVEATLRRTTGRRSSCKCSSSAARTAPPKILCGT